VEAYASAVSVPKIELISRYPGVGIGVAIGIDIEMSVDSDLDSESDSDPDTDRGERKHSRQVLFMRLGAPPAHGQGGIIRSLFFASRHPCALALVVVK